MLVFFCFFCCCFFWLLFWMIFVFGSWLVDVGGFWMLGGNKSRWRSATTEGEKGRRGRGSLLARWLACYNSCTCTGNHDILFHCHHSVSHDNSIVSLANKYCYSWLFIDHHGQEIIKWKEVLRYKISALMDEWMNESNYEKIIPVYRKYMVGSVKIKIECNYILWY